MCSSPSPPKLPPPPPPPPRFIDQAVRDARLKGTQRFGGKRTGFRGTFGSTSEGVLDEAQLVRENLVASQ